MSYLDPPVVSLSLGSTLNPEDIKEGDDVYFECHIKSNPSRSRLTWVHNVSIFKFVLIFEQNNKLSFVLSSLNKRAELDIHPYHHYHSIILDIIV